MQYLNETPTLLNQTQRIKYSQLVKEYPPQFVKDINRSILCSFDQYSHLFGSMEVHLSIPVAVLP